MNNEQLESWAQTLRVTPGHEDTGAAILKLLDDWKWLDGEHDAMEMALRMQSVEPGDDLVATMERVLQRYAFVVDTFNNREEFDFSGDDYMPQMLGVLAQGDRALSFKWKVCGVLRKAGAIDEKGVNLNDTTLVMILEAMMP